IERGQCGADQVGAPGGGKVAGQEGVAADIDAVDAANDDTALPDEFVAPVGPPAAARRSRGCPTSLDAGASAMIKIAISVGGPPRSLGPIARIPPSAGGRAGSSA